MLEALPCPALAFDAGAKLTAVNPQAVELLQCEGKQLLGRAAENLLHPVYPGTHSSEGRNQEHPVSHALRSQHPQDQLCFEFFSPGESEPIRLTGRISPVAVGEQTRGAIVSLTSEPVDRGAFLAGMSHEIRTPLNSLLGMLQLLEQGELTPDQHEAVHIALDSGRCLLEIVNDILDLARIEIGEITLTEVSFDPAEILHAVAALFIPVAEDKEINFLIDAPAASHQCLGDAARLRQILFNLLGHALRHTDHGDIRVVMSHLPSTQDGTMQVDFQISAYDPEASRDRIVFSPSPCVPTSNTFRETGLGLPIAQRLIALMGGSINLKVVDSGGSEARVVLPFKQGSPFTKDGDHHEEDLPSLQILLVEDDKVNQLATRRLLSKAGHKVVSASDGSEALTALEQIRFDMILMDGAMPHLDGLETTRRIRASERPYAAIPIIALTAHAMQGDRERFLEAGMDGYLAKPLEFGEFTKTVIRILHRRKR